MNFLADESIEGEIVAELRRADYLVADVKELSPGIADEAVLALAVDHDSVLITNDRILAN